MSIHFNFELIIYGILSFISLKIIFEHMRKAFIDKIFFTLYENDIMKFTFILFTIFFTNFINYGILDTPNYSLTLFINIMDIIGLIVFNEVFYSIKLDYYSEELEKSTVCFITQFVFYVAIGVFFTLAITFEPINLFGKEITLLLFTDLLFAITLLFTTILFPFNIHIFDKFKYVLIILSLEQIFEWANFFIFNLSEDLERFIFFFVLLFIFTLIFKDIEKFHFSATEGCNDYDS